jgi:hypothetical protein
MPISLKRQSPRSLSPIARIASRSWARLLGRAEHHPSMNLRIGISRQRQLHQPGRRKTPAQLQPALDIEDLGGKRRPRLRQRPTQKRQLIGKARRGGPIGQHPGIGTRRRVKRRRPRWRQRTGQKGQQVGDIEKSSSRSSHDGTRREVSCS